MLADARMMPIVAPADDSPTLPAWLQSYLGTGTAGKGKITILDLSLVPSDVVATIVAVVARLVFEAAQRFRRATGTTMPTVVVLEEAHNFVQRENLSGEDGAASQQCRTAFEKIAREGRKFGVSLVLSSQRPAELSPTVVAQCNSFLLHRIVNDRDQELVSRLVPDSAGSLLKELPSLPAQQAVLLGLATEIPVVVDMRSLSTDQRPRSSNPDLWDVWTGERDLVVDIEQLAKEWTKV